MVYPSDYDVTLLNRISLTKKAKDLTNNVYGKLVALYPIENTGKSNTGTIFWLCKCSCGNYSTVIGSALTSGVTVSCGCFGAEQRKIVNTKDITGQKFNRLLALEPTENKKNGVTIWKFRCDCGNIVEKPLSDVKRGNTKSCGCAHMDQAKAQGISNKKDITNQKFGKLTAISSLDRRTGGGYFWKCVCDCGIITEVNICNLLSGAVKSCGCLNKEATQKRFMEYRLSKGQPADILMSTIREHISSIIRPVTRLVMKSDGYKCAICNKQGGDLYVHHITKRAEDISLAAEPTNLITLCKLHHGQAHCNNFNGDVDMEFAEYLSKVASLRESTNPIDLLVIDEINTNIQNYLTELMEN
jgi:hypothetical protein